MSEFTVEWKLTVEAEDATDAARQALAYQLTQEHKRFLVYQAGNYGYQDGDIIDLEKDTQ